MTPTRELDPYRVDLSLSRQRSERAAQTYDSAALAYREQSDRLIEHLEPIKLDPATILDVGAATGHSTRALSKRFPRAFVCGVDWAPARLALARRRSSRAWFRQSRQTFACADAHGLPFRPASVDLVFVGAVPGSSNNLDGLTREFARVLRPGGLLAFAAFGPDTLMELRACWTEIDAELPEPPTRCHRFLDMHDHGDNLQRFGFSGVVMDAERLTLTYESVDALLRELKDLGDTNATAARPTGLTHPGRLQRLRVAYERYQTPEGRMPVTCELVYAHAWRTEQPINEAAIPVEQLRSANDTR